MLIDELGDGERGHEQEERADELRAARQGEVRSEPRAEQLAGAERETGQEEHGAGGGEKGQRRGVAREVHHLRVCGGLHEIVPEHHDERDCPERAHARPEESVVEPERDAEECVERRPLHPVMPVRVAELRAQQHVDHHRRQQPRDAAREQVRIEPLHRERPRHGAERRPRHARDAFAQVDCAAPRETPRRRRRAEDGAELVRAQRQRHRHPRAEQRGQRDQAAAARDRIDDAGAEAGAEQQHVGGKGQLGHGRPVNPRPAARGKPESPAPPTRL